LNLVANAIDACIFDDTTDKKHRVSVKTTLTDNRFINFEVKDNGSGMTPEVKTKLFTSFFSTKGPKGTGLGLLVTHKLIEEHNGGIHVLSEPGKGSTFIFKLPFKSAGGGNGMGI
jgi:signal transduction histidine kinase